MADLIGQTLLNRYRVAELLGRGGMAQVYKVWDQQRTVFLAMKVLHDDLARDKVFLRRFAREAQILNQLQHPHIVRFYGLEQEGLQAFLLMDYVQGSTLRDEIFQLNGAMKGTRILEVMRPICSALNYAHQMGLIHCDVKPANIMIQENGNVLVADFGIARLIENSTTTTMSGAGTPAYMSPEQAMGHNPVAQTDVYSLGIVLYEMATGGERPFTGEHALTGGSTAEKMRWEHLQAMPPSPRQYNPDLSPQMEAVVLKCLEKNPVQRYSSATELFSDLEKSIFFQGDNSSKENKTSMTFVPSRVEPHQEQSQSNNAIEAHPQPRKKGTLIAIAFSLIMLFAAVFGLLYFGGVSALMPEQTQTPTVTITASPSVTPTDTPLPTNTLSPTGTDIPSTFTPTTTSTPEFVDCIYKVQSGDSIYGISVRFGISTDSIKDANGTSLRNPNLLTVGQELLILNASTRICLEQNSIPKDGVFSITQMPTATFSFNRQPTNTPYVAPLVTTTTPIIFIYPTTVTPNIFVPKPTIVTPSYTPSFTPTYIPSFTPTFMPTRAPQISLAGVWIGSGYKCGGVDQVERVQIQDFGNNYFVVTKIDGDACVGSGAKTWEGTYNNPDNNFPMSFGVSVWIKDTSGQSVTVGRTAYMPNANRIEIQMSSYILVFTR